MAKPNFSLKNQWLNIPSLFLSLTTFICCCLPSQAKISYPEHCSAIVPQASPSSFALDTANSVYVSNGHFSGGDNIFGAGRTAASQQLLTYRVGFNFYANQIYRTEKLDIFHLTGSLNLQGNRDWVTFNMAGFWSSTTGKICMVGTGSARSNGTYLKLSAVFNLNYPNNSTIYTSVVSGTVRSVDASDSKNHFDTISVLAYGHNNYTYTQFPKPRGGMCYHVKDPKQLVGFETSSASNYLGQLLPGKFRLDYGSDCSNANCGPFSSKNKKNLKFLPTFMTMNMIQSSEDGKVHMQLGFTNASGSDDYYNSYLIPGRSLVSEGYWDSDKKVLCLLACPVLEDSTGDSHVGECTIGLSLWFPSVFTIKERSSVVGRIWSVKGKSDPGYFNQISLRSSGGHKGILYGLKYEYTKADSMRKTCETTKVENLGNRRYPDENTIDDLRFDLTLRNAKESSMSGYATPLSFGDNLYGEGFSGISYHAISSGVSFSENSVNTNKTLWNVSYIINYRVYNSSLNMESVTDIAAEGVYNAEAGKLCMVGCKDRSSSEILKNGKGEDSEDCQIDISIQFSPLNTNNGVHINGSISGTRHVNGTIRSTRQDSDPLYFEPLEISSYNMYSTEAVEIVQRMDMEIAMVVITLTLACIFIIFQIFHVRKHQDALPSMSITMLIILTLGYMIPLVLNFEALFLMSRRRKSALLWSGGWLEVKEVVVRVITMVAFFLQCRLLQLAWTARSSEEGGKDLWIAERKVLRFCLPLYFAGALIAWFVHTKYYRAQGENLDYISHGNRSIWDNLICYAGLILDGFLLPQIILNICRNSKDKALSPLFYTGTTGVRALPHLYDAYRASNYVTYFKFSNIYASPDGDYYSTTWDIVIPLVGLLFAVLLCLQQRLGARCFLPQRFRKLGGYEMVPVISM